MVKLDSTKIMVIISSGLVCFMSVLVWGQIVVIGNMGDEIVNLRLQLNQTNANQNMIVNNLLANDKTLCNFIPECVKINEQSLDMKDGN